jgi:hypothetical protein
MLASTGFLKRRAAWPSGPASIIRDRIKTVERFVDSATAEDKSNAASSAIGWAIENAYKRAVKQGWDRIYWAIDLHDTVIQPSYEPDKIGDAFPHAIDTLLWLLSLPETRIILWSSMSKEELITHRNELLGVFGNPDGKVFLNENPECGATRYANFDQKMYFNVLLDDKAGFRADRGWQRIQLAVSACRESYKPTWGWGNENEFIEVTEHT